MAAYAVLIDQLPDGTYVATCPALPDCTATAPTYESCLTAIRRAIATHHPTRPATRPTAHSAA